MEHPNIIGIIDINFRTKVKKGIKRVKTYCIMDLMVKDLGSIIKETYKKKK